METTGTLMITTMAPKLVYDNSTRKHVTVNEKIVTLARVAYVTQDDARTIVGDYEKVAHGTIFAQWQADVVQIR